MEKEELQNAFEHYLSGEASPEETGKLLLYFHLKEESTVLTSLIEQEIAKPSFTDEKTLQQRQPVYDRVLDAINTRIDAEQETVVVPLWRKTVYRVASIAAVLLLVSTAVIWFTRQKPASMIAVNVPFGQMKKITLPDSSHVWLNAGSRLSYPSVFTGKLRSVQLTGQAFFEVVHISEHPFMIKTGNISVTVLGTSFEIKAFEKENETRVTVATGKVGVTLAASGQQTTFLLPNQQALIHKGSNNIETRRVTDIAAWRENRLVFDNDNLGSVFNSLERKYNKHIRVLKPSLLGEVTSMKLSNQPLSDVLTVLSFSKHFQYQLANDSTIIIR